MQWNLKQIESFVWVAKLGSFRQTAERLNTTQPNISQRISGLENLLETRLFDRDTGAVLLTPAGSALLGYAERVLASADAFSAQAGQGATQGGVIRLGVTEVIAQSWLRHFMKALMAEFPRLEVDLTVDLTVNLKRELLGHALDLGLLNGPISDHHISNVELGAAPILWVAEPALAARIRTIADMAAQPILTPARNTRPFVEIAAHFRENWDGAVRLVPSTSLSAAVQMTLDGMGVAALPLPLAQDHLAAGGLAKVAYAWVPSPLGVTASYPHTPANRMVRRAALIAAEVAAEHG